MPEIRPVETDDTGLSFWVVIGVVAAALVLLMVPAWYLLDQVTNAESAASESAGGSGTSSPTTLSAAPTTTSDRPVHSTTEQAASEAPTSGTLTVVTDTVLTRDHNGRIVIGANNVTLDCDGHTVVGPGRRAGLPGVSMVQRSGVTVKNCIFTDFNDAFRVEQSHNNTFLNNDVSTLRQGFTLLGSDNNTLTGNTVTDADDWFGYGILDGSDGNQLTDNTADRIKGVGFIVFDSNNNVLVGNSSSNGSGTGLGANGSSTNNTFTGNNTNANTGWGIEDQTRGASGDEGTRNHYSDNSCISDGAGQSSPPGLC